MATLTGSMSGFSFITTGVPMESSQSPSSRSIWEEISSSAVFMSAPSAYCSTTSDRFSLEVEEMLFTSVRVAKAASSGRVTSLSTRSGVEPT